MTALFLSYAHSDIELINQLEKQLSILKRQSVIEIWHDRMIEPGSEWQGVLDSYLENADIILLLISPDFLASDYCYDIEMKRAIERHESGDAIVIPVILRPCLWQDSPFGKLQCIPSGGVAITKWANPDEAMLDVATGIKEAAKRNSMAKKSNIVSSSVSAEKTHFATFGTRKATPEKRSINLNNAKHSNLAFNSPGAIQAQTVIIKATQKSKKLIPPAGTLGADADKLTYVKKLIDQYNDFAKREPTRSQKFSHAAIYIAIKR
jgi:TIR domain